MKMTGGENADADMLSARYIRLPLQVRNIITMDATPEEG